MSRYYVVLPGASSLGPFIVAEVVRERRDRGMDRDTTTAAGIAGPSAEIMTREELEATEEGYRALKKWDAHDDTLFDLDNIRLDLAIGSGPRAASRPQKGTEWMAETTRRSAELRSETRVLRRHVRDARIRLHAMTASLRKNRILCQETIEEVAHERQHVDVKPRRRLRSVS